MKILYKTMGLGLLSACLCLLCAAPASAKVCFVGDENCGAGGSFEPAEKLPNEDLCRQEGYTSLASTCLNPGGTCPYDAKYVKCCGSEYAYQACVFPLETIKVQNSEGKTVTDKCGSLYKCQCNSEYKTPADWSDEASNKCQPGGGVCIMSTTDTVYYNKCTCDGNYFPYEKSCPKNTTEIDSCTDSDGLTRKSCQCPNTYKTCTYGGAPGADTCIQNGITLYSSCNTPEQECINAGYYENCSKQRCYYDTQNMEKNKSTYPIACENSNDVCPYMFGYYFCRWSPLNFCKAKHAEMNIESPENPPSNCIKQGVQGTVIPCKIDYDGEGKRMYRNTTDPTKYLGYYRCKLNCKQQAEAAALTGDLTEDPYFRQLTASATKGYYRKDSAGNYHLYLTGDLDVMSYTGSQQKNSDNNSWTQGKGAFSSYSYAHTYSSINGVMALYDIDSSKFDACDDDRSDKSKRPTLILDQYKLESNPIKYLDVDLSDINVQFYASQPDSNSSYGEVYLLSKSHKWKNVKLSVKVPSHNCTIAKYHGNYVPRSCGDSYDGTYYMTRQHNGGCQWYGSYFDITGGKNTTITFTGDIDFDFSSWVVDDGSRKDPYTGETQETPEFSMRPSSQGTKIIFDNAVISKSGGDAMDWDGASGATMIFKNSYGYMGNVWSHWNVGIYNVPSGQTLNFNLVKITGWENGDTNTSLGGSYSTIYSKKCYGFYLRSGTVTINNSFRINGGNSKVYVGGKLTSGRPLVLAGANNHEICVAYGGTFIGNNYNSSYKRTVSGQEIYYGRKGNTCIPYWTGDYSVNKGYAIGCAQDYWMQGRASTPSSSYSVSGSWYSWCEKNNNEATMYPCSMNKSGYNGWLSDCVACSSGGMGYNQ